eukprot:2312875-Pyramimonas_sp.AAC.1
MRSLRHALQQVARIHSSTQTLTTGSHTLLRGLVPMSNGACTGPFGLSHFTGGNLHDRDEKKRQSFNLLGRRAFSTSTIVTTSSTDAATSEVASASTTHIVDAAPLLAEVATAVAQLPLGSEVAAIADQSRLPIQYT